MRTPSVAWVRVSWLSGAEYGVDALGGQLAGTFGVASSDASSEEIDLELCELLSSEQVESSSRRDSAELKDSHGSSLMIEAC